MPLLDFERFGNPGRNWENIHICNAAKYVYH
jgi:hypothetical protein